MATLSKTAALLALALTAGFGASSLLAATKPAAQSAATQTVTTLGGKFPFNLPKAFTADTLPAGDAADGTAGTNGTMYTNSVARQVDVRDAAGRRAVDGGVNARDVDGDGLAVVGELEGVDVGVDRRQHRRPLARRARRLEPHRPGAGDR